VVKWVRTLPRDLASDICARQLIRSATSVGANIEEADGADRNKDKIYKWTTSRKEARESRFWMRTICASNTETPEALTLIQESTELINILSSLIKKSKDSLNSP
jgi:four helix bundle protein